MLVRTIQRGELKDNFSVILQQNGIENENSSIPSI